MKRYSTNRQFSRAAEYYADSALLQKRVATRLISGLRMYDAASRILEVGCGTGFLTGQVLQIFPEAKIDAIDSSEKMISIARQSITNRKVQFHVADGITYSGSEPYDLIISSSALHWLQPIGPAIAHLSSLLKKGGKICFVLMIYGTLLELRTLRAIVAPSKMPEYELPSIKDVESSLRGADLVLENIETYEEIENYKNPKHLLREIKRLGLTGGRLSYGRALLSRSELLKLCELYKQHYSTDSDSVFATYRMLEVRAELAI